MSVQSHESRAQMQAAQLLAGLKSLEDAIALGAFAALVIVLFADVASRELIGTGLAWSRQVGVYANLFLTLAGIGLASASGSHLRPRFADRWLPAAWDPWLGQVRETVMALFFLGAVVVSAEAIAETRVLDERVPLLGWPVWRFQLMLPAVFLAGIIRHGCYAIWPALRPPEAGGEAA